MLKVLIIPGFRLYPVDSGGAHAQLAFLEKMQHQQETDIIITPDNIAYTDIPAFRLRFPQLNLLLVGYTALSGRQMLWRFFKKLKRKISGSHPAYKLRKYGFLQNRPERAEEIKRIACAKEYDIIQADHSINMGLAEILPEKPKKIFVHHEIAHTRIASDLRSTGYTDDISRRISTMVERIERGWLNLYDGIITLCREDAGLLQSHGVYKPVRIAEPFALFEGELKRIYDSRLSPSLLFAGGETHYPNKEGLNWFLREVFPLVQKQIPACVIRITGTWSGAFQKQFTDNSNIQFTGFVHSLEQLYKNSILVVPVRIGSGIRIKVITAFANAVPVIGTSTGLSGIPGIKNEENALIADDATGFAAYVVSLLQDEAQRERLSSLGFLLAQEGYREGKFTEERTGFYKELLERQ